MELSRSSTCGSFTSAGGHQIERQGLVHISHILRESTGRVRLILHCMFRVVTRRFKVTPVSVTEKYDSGALTGMCQWVLQSVCEGENSVQT